MASSASVSDPLMCSCSFKYNSVLLFKAEDDL